LCAEEKAESSIDPLGGEILVLTEMGDLDGGVNARLSATAGRLNCLAPRRWIGESIKRAAIRPLLERVDAARFSIGEISGRCLRYLGRGYIKRLSFSREPSSPNLLSSGSLTLINDRESAAAIMTIITQQSRACEKISPAIRHS